MRIDIDISKSGQKIYFISDLHCWHGKNKESGIIKIDNRPFETIEEMHQTIIENWNATVSKKDIVFYLGDLSFSKWKNSKEIVDQLNGKIHFIMGNHDRFSEIQKIERFETINDIADLWLTTEEGKFHLVLCHFPILSWNRKHHGSILIHGHSHQGLFRNSEFDWFYKGLVFDVGCNGINYTPISFEQVKNIITNKL